MVCCYSVVCFPFRSAYSLIYCCAWIWIRMCVSCFYLCICLFQLTVTTSHTRYKQTFGHSPLGHLLDQFSSLLVLWKVDSVFFTRLELDVTQKKQQKKKEQTNTQHIISAERKKIGNANNKNLRQLSSGKICWWCCWAPSYFFDVQYQYE